MKKRTRKALIFTVKLVVAAALLAFVAHKIEWNDYVRVVEGNQVVCRGLRSTITSANGYFLAAAFVLFVIPMLMLAVRWWYLLRILDIRLSFREAVRLTFLGTFFNFVIPGMVSGDVVKAYYVFKHTDRKAAALLSVFVDRVVGLLEFAVLPALVMAYMYAAGANTDRLLLPAVVVAVVLAGVVLSLAVLLSRPLRRALRLNRILSRLPWQPHLAVAAEAAELYRRRLTGLLKAMGITFVGQTVFLAGIMLAGLTLAPAVTWYQYFLYVPLIIIIGSVPISPGGLGVTEYFYVTFLASAGATAPEALAVALVARLFPMICSLPGLVVAVTGPRRPGVEQMQAELGGSAR